MFDKPKKWKSPKYRDAARGQNCTLRFPGCRNEVETVVLCHRNGAGMALRSNDFDSADGCFHCHSILDDASRWPFHVELMEREFERARYETIVNRITRGILK
jgi:hypothetical protein